MEDYHQLPSNTRLPGDCTYENPFLTTSEPQSAEVNAAVMVGSLASPAQAEGNYALEGRSTDPNTMFDSVSSILLCYFIVIQPQK